MSNDRDPAYFGYYAQFVHQQNMLQDHTRTSFYYNAIQMNKDKMFKDKLVLDIGAGSGILSYFAAQAGAQKTFAVEASTMAKRIQKMLDSITINRNAWMKDRIQVFQEKIERPLPIPKVDTIISEPIGVLLVHERMIESFLIGRDNYLKPGGDMIPSSGSIFLAPFSDAALWTQTMAKVRFWEQESFYGIDFSPLAKDAKDEIFGQPVVGNFDHRLLMAPSCSYSIDFKTISIPKLQKFFIPINWTFPYTGIVHGVAGWFDITLGTLILSTSPSSERTHWQQVRFLFKEPLAVNAYETVHGWMYLNINENRSYDILCEISTNRDCLSQPTIDASSLRTDRFLDANKRVGSWQLDQQSYYFVETPVDTLAKPEYIGLYSPDNDTCLPDIDI